jgi:hypothetical protein
MPWNFGWTARVAMGCFAFLISSHTFFFAFPIDAELEDTFDAFGKCSYVQTL